MMVGVVGHGVDVLGLTFFGAKTGRTSLRLRILDGAVVGFEHGPVHARAVCGSSRNRLPRRPTMQQALVVSRPDW